jgi:hypothetical protein
MAGAGGAGDVIPPNTICFEILMEQCLNNQIDL